MRYIIMIIICFFCTNSYAENKNVGEQKQRPLIKILAIDGGGVRGVIPAYILNELEKKLPKGEKIADYFDVIAGTSAGGIIALLLTVPNDDGSPKYSAEFVFNNTVEFSKQAFQNSFWRQIYTGGGLWNTKYSADGLQKNLATYFGDIKLSQTTTNVIIPAYEIEQDKTFFFKTSRAKNELMQDCYIKDLAYATSAAPTYFPPARLVDQSNRTLSLIDGGVSINNPALAASVYALEVYGDDIDLFVVSIGTGTNYSPERKNITYENVKSSGVIGWIKNLIPMMMYASNQVTDYEMYYVFNFKRPKYYFRLQPVLESKDSEMDNVSDKNINILKKYAKDLVEQQQEELNQIVAILQGNKFM